MTQAARTVGDMVIELARQLNDYRSQNNYVHIRWTEVELTTYINEAIRQLAGLKPHLFTTNVRHTLKRGCTLQESPCDEMLGVVATLTCKNGRPTQNSLEAETISKWIEYFPVTCSSDIPEGIDGDKAHLYISPDDYSVEAVVWDPDNPKIFFVHPAPPLTGDVDILVACRGLPKLYNWPDDKSTPLEIAERLEPYVWHYALHLAYEKDHESETSIRRSESNYDHAKTYLDQERQADWLYVRQDLYEAGSIVSPTGELLVGGNSIVGTQTSGGT